MQEHTGGTYAHFYFLLSVLSCCVLSLNCDILKVVFKELSEKEDASMSKDFFLLLLLLFFVGKKVQEFKEGKH